MAAEAGSAATSAEPLVSEETVLAGHVDWAALASVRHEEAELFITSDDVARLEEYHGYNGAAVAELLSTDEDAGAYVRVLMKVLDKVSSNVAAVRFAVTVLKSVLVSIMMPRDVEEDTQAALDAFRERPGDHSSRLHMAPLMRALQQADDRGDVYTLDQAATAAARMVAGDDSPTPPSAALMRWATSAISAAGSVLPGTPDGLRAETAVGALMLMLRHPTVREGFAASDTALPALRPLLASKDLQLAYEAANCMWVLSFSPPGRRAMSTHGVVVALCDTLRTDLPAKLLRMATMTLANIVEHFDGDREGHPGLPEPLPLIGEAGVATALGELPKLAAKAAKFADPELQEAGEYLALALERSRRHLTSLARYQAHLAAGRFKPGPLHGSEFWAENVGAFESNGWAMVKSLRELLVSSDTDDVTAAVAVGDVGEFAVFHPHGRQVLVGMGMKEVVMGLMHSPHTSVRHAALLTLSKLMLNKWDFAPTA